MIYIEIPPLRARRGDVEPLFAHFNLQYATRRGLPCSPLTNELPAALNAYDWPENVRELKAVAERLAATHHQSAANDQTVASILPVDPQPSD
jgi:DNA-binding NtrC family response regulator